MENISVTTTIKDNYAEVIVSRRLGKHKWQRLKYIRIDEDFDVKVYNTNGTVER